MTITNGRPVPAEHPVPTLAFDTLLEQMVERAGELIGSRSRLQALIRANHALVHTLDLSLVLERVCLAATTLTDARYAAVLVFDDDGEVIDFVHHGFTPAQVEAIGDPPRGHGLLGAVPATESLRLEHMGEHPASAGLPANHPPMESFLGVPIHMRDRVLGNLYLTEQRSGRFSSDDEELTQALAATAAVAIANARLFDDVAYRERWSSVLAETARKLAASEGGEVETLLETAVDMADAALVYVTLPARDPSTLEVTHALGLSADSLIGVRLPRASSLVGEALAGGVLLTDAEMYLRANHGYPSMDRLGHAMVVPFEVEHIGTGALTLVRDRDNGRFRPRDTHMARAFAAHLAVVLAQHRVTLLEERHRIAQDLHDHVIQRLFAVGLGLETVAGRSGDTDVARRLMELNDEVFTAISQIRQSIYSLDRPAEPATLRDHVTEVIESAQGLPTTPTLVFTGPVDAVSDPTLTDDVCAVVREALSNAVRHGHADTARVEVRVEDHSLVVEVDDDGAGLPDVVVSRTLSGLSNMRRRAERRGGTCHVGASSRGHGTQVTWTVPLAGDDD